MHPVDELLAIVDSVRNERLHESDAVWQQICELDVEIAVAAKQGFPDVPQTDCEKHGFCRIPLSRTISETEPGLAIHLMTAPGFGEASSQWRQAMAILRRTVPPRKPAKKGVKPKKKGMKHQQVDAHCNKVLESGDQDLIGTYVESSMRKLAPIIGCSRNTLAKTEFIRNQSLHLNRWHRENATRNDVGAKRQNATSKKRPSD